MLRSSILTMALVLINLPAHAFGLSVDLGNVFSQLASQSGTQTSVDTVDQVLQQLSRELNQKMPMKIDSVTRLDRVSAEPGRHLTYHYTVVPLSDAGNMQIDFSREIKPQLKSQLCSNPDTQKFLKNGVTLAYQYQDENAHNLGVAELTPSDCGYMS